MKLIKPLMLLASAVGIYKTVKYLSNRKKIAEDDHIEEKATKYIYLTPEEARLEFKQRISAGEWLSREEYADLMQAMKTRFVHQPVEPQLAGEEVN